MCPLNLFMINEMHSSSPSHCSPSTPAFPRHPLQFRPSNSSPLIDSPSLSSPVVEAQARRKSQYKARPPQTPTVPSRRISGNYSEGSRLLRPKNSLSAYAVCLPESLPNLSMRDKFRARCFERAIKAREKAIKGKRYVANFPSSDDQVMDDDESEDEEEIMKDELFRRIMENTNRRQQHSYRLSYETEVGSSFDPNLEDADAWERELAAPTRARTRSDATSPASMKGEEFTPFDLDEAELEEYAEEYARITALADFEDLREEELFGWSDFEESPQGTAQVVNEGDSMDVS